MAAVVLVAVEMVAAPAAVVATAVAGPALEAEMMDAVVVAVEEEYTSLRLPVRLLASEQWVIVK